MFISGGHDLIFYDATNYKVIHRYSPKRASKIRQASWSRDNNFLVYLSDGAKPIILTCRERDNIRSIVEVNLDVSFTSVIFPRTTKKTLGIGTQSGELLLYNTKMCSRDPIHFEPFADAVSLVDYNANDRLIAGAGGSCVRIYDSARGTQPEVTRALGSKCTAMRFHPCHVHTLALATVDGTVMCLDVTTNSAVYEVQCHKDPVAGMAFSHRANNKYLITVSTDNKYAVHSIMDKGVVQCGHLPHGVTAIDVSDDRNSMLLGTELGHVYQYDLRHCLSPVVTFKAHKSPVLCLRYATDTLSETDDGINSGGQPVGGMMANSAAVGREADMGTMRGVGNAGEGAAMALDKYLGAPAASTSACQFMPPSNSSTHVGVITPTYANVAHDLFDNAQERILQAVGADMVEMGTLMTAQMANLRQFIKQEVDKVDAQNHDKWELLIAAAASGGDSCCTGGGGGRSCYSGSGRDGGERQRCRRGGDETPGSGGDIVHHRVDKI